MIAIARSPIARLAAAVVAAIPLGAILRPPAPKLATIAFPRIWVPNRPLLLNGPRRIWRGIREHLFALPGCHNGLPFVKPGTSFPTNDSAGCSSPCGTPCTCSNCIGGTIVCRVIVTVGGPNPGDNVTLGTSCLPNCHVAGQNGYYLSDRVNGASFCLPPSGPCQFIVNILGVGAADFYLCSLPACACFGNILTVAGSFHCHFAYVSSIGKWAMLITNQVSTNAEHIVFYAESVWDCTTTPLVLANGTTGLGSCMTVPLGGGYTNWVMGTSGIVTITGVQFGTAC